MTRGRGWSSSYSRENERRPSLEGKERRFRDATGRRRPRHAPRYFDFHLDTTRSGTSSETTVLIKAAVVLDGPPPLSLSLPIFKSVTRISARPSSFQRHWRQMVRPPPLEKKVSPRGRQTRRVFSRQRCLPSRATFSSHSDSRRVNRRTIVPRMEEKLPTTDCRLCR